jgi:hypothetical protein
VRSLGNVAIFLWHMEGAEHWAAQAWSMLNEILLHSPDHAAMRIDVLLGIARLSPGLSDRETAHEQFLPYLGLLWGLLDAAVDDPYSLAGGAVRVHRPCR